MKAYLWNMIAIIQNGQLVNAPYVLQKSKNVCRNLLCLLWNEGYILGFKRLKKGDLDFIKIFLKYKNGKPVINICKSITKPGNKVYYTLKQIWKINISTGILIISTNKGLLTAASCKLFKLGGQPLFFIN